MTAAPYLLLCGVLLALSHTISAAPSFMPSSPTETLRNILLSEPHLILGSSNTLYRLNASLSRQQDLALTSPNRMLVADPHGTYSGKVLSCESLHCSLVDVGDIESTVWQVSSGVVRDGPDNVIGVFAPGPNGVSSLTVGERKIQRDNTLPSVIAKGDLINVNGGDASYNEYASHAESNKFRPREFLAAFNFEQYVYLVTRIQIVASGGAIDTIIHIARFCELDAGNSNSDVFGSHFEIELECPSASGNGNGMNSPSGISAVFVNSTVPFGSESIVLVSASMAASNMVNNYMCSYSISEINQLMAEKLSTCLDGDEGAKVGFSREGLLNCPVGLTDEQKDRVDECNLPAAILPGQEVLLPLQNSAFATEQTTGYFTSAVYTTLDGASFLFTGSTEGRLYQFHVQSSSQAVKVREVPLSLPSDVQDDERNVTQLLASEDGTSIYALTPRKLFRHSVDMCETFSSCSDCLNSSDPICGWCTLESRCTREVSCPSVWVEREDECPEINLVHPSTLHLQELSSSPTVRLSTRNLPNENYECVFDFGGEGVPVITEATGDGGAGDYVCSAPEAGKIPPLLEGEDTALSYVSLREVGEENKVVTWDTPVGFIDCSIHESCTSCTESTGDCGWCPFSFNCIRPNIDCDGDDETSLDSDCPSIQPPSEAPDYLIHVNHNYSSLPLVVRGESLGMLFSLNEFVCVICTGNCSSNLYPPLPAVLNQDGNVTCTGRTLFEYTGEEPVIIATLKVQKKTNSEQNIDNPLDTRVILYNCARLGQNCAQCLNISMQYQCSYCQESSNAQRGCNFDLRCDDTPGTITISDVSEISQCELPTIFTFSPQAGPFDGGTEITITGSNLGATKAHIQSVVVDSLGSSVPCNVTAYEPGVEIQCITGSSLSTRVSGPITVQFTYGEDVMAQSNEDFKFEVPTLRPDPATPNRGPESGGTAIEISGGKLGIGSSHHIAIGPNDCSSVSTDPNNLDVITCISPPKFDDPQRDLFITVSIDNWMQTMVGFTYLQDPTFESISPEWSFLAGGTNYTVRGTNLDSVVKPRLIFYTTSANSQLRGKRQSVQQNQILSEPCTIISNVELHCEAPTVQVNDSTSVLVMIGLLMDGVVDITRLNTSVMVYPNPVFNMLDPELQEYSEERIVLMITGQRFLFTADQVSIQLMPCTNEDSVPGDCECIITEIDSNSNTLTCEIRNPQNLATDEPVSVTVLLGNLEMNVGDIEISEPSNLDLLMILIPVIACIFIFGFVFFLVVFAIFCRKTRQKDRRYDQLILELEKLESSVARECKLGFAELQTDLDELTGDVAGCRLPYVDMQSYLLTSLFPGAKDHPIMHPLQIPAHQRPIVEHSLRDFHDLLLDKKVLLIFIHSLEEQRNFSIRDKSIVGSLLMVALHDRLDYATEVLRSLLSELIRRTITNSYPKLLLRRTESVAEKMLTNWLAICLHGYIMEHAGQPMYLMYRAVKNQLEKGPIDVITGEARYSLSEHKLIRQKVDSGVINATVETEDGLRVPVKVLDCDTASQAKEKLLDAVYKAAPVSQRPSLMKVDLEYLKTPLEHMILRDEDHTTMYDGGWKRINTLRHYQVHDGAIFRLVPRKDHAPPGRTWDYPASLISTHCHRQRALSEAEDGTRVWHLFKQLDVEDPKRSPFMNKKMVSEIYLPRMLSTKSILQKFVDDLFNCLFNISHPPSSPSNAYTNFFPHSPGVQVPMGYAPGADTVPMAIKYLFDFLDDEAANMKIQDMDVVHTWKNNALSLRFWVNMIKNPEFVFDINKSHTVDACLSVIAQAFIDGCSFADVKLNIDSPTSKLLYNKEVQGYKVQVRRYYEDVSRLPRVPEDAMQFYLKQLSTYQTQLMNKNGGFITESALYELLRYGIKYHEPFLSNLRVAGLESKAQLFEGVLRAAAV